MSEKLPCHECRGKCCTYPPFSEAEFQTVKFTKGIPPGATVMPITRLQSYNTQNNGTPAYVIHMPNGNCPWLGKDGKCGIYELRPQTCRDYGVVEALPCEYLYPKKAKQLQDERMKKSRLFQ